MGSGKHLKSVAHCSANLAMSETEQALSADAPLVSVIVAAYHSAEFLPACLHALENQTFRNFETIIVNSSPEHRTAEVVARFPFAKLLQSNQRLLPHAAMNAGATEAKGSLLVFTAADTKADPDWLSALIASHESGHHVIGGSIDSDATSCMSRGMQIAKYSPLLRGRPSGPVYIAASGNMLVSREAWKAVGPFDGSIYCGDVLLTWKARRLGLAPWHESEAVVFDTDGVFRLNFLTGRFQRGKEFGQMRATFEQFDVARRLLCIFYTPVAIVTQIAETGRICLEAGRFADFLVTLALQVASRMAWCIGEAVGYSIRPSQRS